MRPSLTTKVTSKGRFAQYLFEHILLNTIETDLKDLLMQYATEQGLTICSSKQRRSAGSQMQSKYLKAALHGIFSKSIRK